MTKLSIKEARENLKAILGRVAAGEQFSILRRGAEVARLVPPEPQQQRRAPSLAAFRRSIKVKGKPLSLEVIESRRKERY